MRGSSTCSRTTTGPAPDPTSTPSAEEAAHRCARRRGARRGALRDAAAYDAQPLANDPAAGAGAAWRRDGPQRAPSGKGLRLAGPHHPRCATWHTAWSRAHHVCYLLINRHVFLNVHRRTRQEALQHAPRATRPRAAACWCTDHARTLALGRRQLEELPRAHQLRVDLRARASTRLRPAHRTQSACRSAGAKSCAAPPALPMPLHGTPPRAPCPCARGRHSGANALSVTR